ncbi:MAG: HEAT repeat domain-containing protein [Ignavibacteriales bacterium]|nr:HEAT repeat domain-containing protein [Ignavibacteriales bacterium]
MTTEKHVIELLPDFLMGTFNEYERSDIQGHLKTCEECRREYESLSMLWNSLGALPEQKPSPAMRERFYAMLSAYEQGIHHAASKTAAWTSLNDFLSRLWPKQPAIQFAMGIILFLLGGVLGTRIDQGIERVAKEESNSEIAQLRGEVHAMSRMLAVSLLKQQSASERLKGVSMSYDLGEGDQELTAALLSTLKYDASPNVRIAALEVLIRFIDQERVRKELIHSLPTQSSPMVQLAMVELMVQTQEQESKPVLQKLLLDPKIDKTVKKRVEESIKQIL